MALQSKTIRPIAPANLAWRCPPEWLSFQTTDEIKSFEEDARQREAVAALRLGVRIRARGYNIYVAGLPGTGRSSTVRSILEDERCGPTPDDLLYVHNVEDPRSPRFLRLPAGKGRVLRERMADVAERFRQGVAALRASGAHRRRREQVARGHRERQAKLVAAFQDEIAKQGFALLEVNLGAFKRHEVAPLVDGQPVALGDLPGLEREGKLTGAAADELRRAHSDLSARLAETSAELRALGRALEQALAAADREAARPLVEETIAEVRHAVGLELGERPAFDEHLANMSQYLLTAFPTLFAAGEGLPGESAEEAGAPDLLEALKINVLVDRTGQQGRPVVEEILPTPARLLGYVEVQKTPEGAVRADLSGIRAGALHQADGGFLLVNAHELVAEEGAWTALRRALRTGRIAIQAPASAEGGPPLTPAEADVEGTVILVGSPALRDSLAQGDEEFTKLFKVTALLEDRVPLTREAVASYTAYLARVAAEERLPPFEAAAVARIMEYMVRLAGVRSKLSTRFRLLTDLAREAAWHAREAQASPVARGHVEQALAARRARQGLLSGRIMESIREGALLLQFEGARVGQVNALAVVETSLERFGYPVRVTATTSVGRSGIIDIEREAELSGEIHTKASLILAGFLRSCFAQHYPLSATVSICFEQSYGGVEGDSASSAELAAVLSSLAEAPVRQDLAVTGAVDQQGNMLAVGGVNEKIEGFWRACRTRQLTGLQGVVIPTAAAPALQLDPELVDDVEQSRFTVYAVDAVGELIELLTGSPLGVQDAQGKWPPGTLGERINKRLEAMAQALKEFGGPSAA